MSQITCNEVVTALPTFTPEQLRTIATAANFLTPEDTAKEQQKDGEMWHLYTCLADQLQLVGTTLPPLHTLQKTARYNDLKRALNTALTFTGTHWPRATKRQRLMLYRLFARIIVRHIQQRGLPAMVSCVGNVAGNIGALFDKQFPGYLRSGLAHVVLRMLDTNRIKTPIPRARL